MPRPNPTDTAKATDSGAPRRVRPFSPRGSALLVVIASIALLGALGGGVAYFSSSSSMSQVTQGGSSRAYYAAASGEKYADKLSTAELAALENSTTHYTLTDGVDFDLTVGTKSGGQYPVTAVGMTGAGTSLASNSRIGPVLLPKDAPDLDLLNSSGAPPLTEAGAQSPWSSWPISFDANKLIDVVTDDNGESYIRLGYNNSHGTHGSACIWYNGSLELFDVSNYCENGECKFGSGFRVYFEFQFIRAGADGFTFAVVNANNNGITDCGGSVNIFGPTGELLGYAGEGSSGHGLRPAKLAVEFDTYKNARTLFDSCFFSDSRADEDDGHVAYVYWGDICECATYDDNIHGAGGDRNRDCDIDGNYSRHSSIRNTRNMTNTVSTSGSDITYKRVANLEDLAVHTFRLEVTRSTNANRSGSYTLKSWLDCTVDGQPCSGIRNVSKDFEESIKSPDLVTTVTMDEYFHNLFDTFIFGFTEGTGGQVQELRVKDIRLSFKQ